MRERDTRRSATGRWFRLALLLGVIGSLGCSRVASADGSAPLPLTENEGCFGISSYGIPMFETGAGSVTVDPPGPILGVFLHWVGAEDDTPPTPGTSVLEVNGVDVSGVSPPPPADRTNVFEWFSWWANIGPAGGPFGGLGLVDDANPVVDVSGWDNANLNAKNGAAVIVIYDTGPCTELNLIEIQVGVDWYFYGSVGDEVSELTVFAFPPVNEDRIVSFQVSHAGTDAGQNACRGGAIWMLTGTGAAPAPGAFDLCEEMSSGRRRGINGGVEIVNDPFTSDSLPCVPRLNPAPDEPYEPGHPCPGGATGCAYHALAMRPAEGGDVGPEWGVNEVDVLIPANGSWVAFQLESEADEDGESGSWAGASYVFSQLPFCGDGILQPGEECDDGNNINGDGCSEDCKLDDVVCLPLIVCAPCERCTDPGTCSADVPCEEIASAVDPQGNPLPVSCDVLGPYGLGTTEVQVSAGSGLTAINATCQVSVRDCEPPTCDPPVSRSLECNGPCGVTRDDPEIQAFLSQVTAADNCALDSTESFVPELFPSGCGGGAATPVVFVATDEVGYDKACASEILVTDTTPPALACPDPLTIECTEPGGVPATDPLVACWLGSASASDTCSEAAVVAAAPALIPAECDPASATLVSFTASDECGNVTVADCPISVVDTEGPLVDCALAPVVEPAGAAPPCSASSSALVEVVCGPARDACGNEPITQTAAVTVNYWEIIDEECELIEETFDVDCGEVIELELMQPPCPAEPSSPRSGTSTLPTGTRLFMGEVIRLVVTATDACDNTSVCEAETSVCLCVEDPECPLPPCGEPDAPGPAAGCFRAPPGLPRSLQPLVTPPGPGKG